MLMCLAKILYKYFTNVIDPGTERVGRKKAIALDCYFNSRKPGGFQ